MTWQGRYDRFENVPMEMTPLQKPYPPMWYGAHSPDSAERAANKGFNIVTNDGPGNARSIIDRYRQVWQRTQNQNAMPKAGLVRFIVVAETDGDALTIARRAYLRWRSSFVYLSAMHGALPDSPLNVESFDQLIEQGQAIAGSVDTVRAFLRKQMEISGANYLVGQFCFGDLSLDEMFRSVELFALHIMPELKTS